MGRFVTPLEQLGDLSYPIRGIFVMGHARMLFQKFFLRRTQAGTAFQNLFSWHQYNAPPGPNFVSLCIPEPIFFRKTALPIINGFILIVEVILQINKTVTVCLIFFPAEAEAFLKTM
jgi:hypothetical protein